MSLQRSIWARLKYKLPDQLTTSYAEINRTFVVGAGAGGYAPAFTPALADLINVREADRGRPISDLTGQLAYGDIDVDVKKVVRTLSTIEREIVAQDGTTYMMRIRPYRTVDNVIEGVVLTFIDITGRRRSGAATGAIEAILEDAFHELYVCDAETWRFVVVNRGARENLGYTIDELRKLTPRDIAPDLAAGAFEKLIDSLAGNPRKRLVRKTTHLRKDGTRYAVDWRLTRIADPPLLVVRAMESKKL